MIPETISRLNVDGKSRVVEETARAESATRTVETATTDSAAAHEQWRTGSEKTLSRWRPLPSPSSELLEEHLRTDRRPVVGDRRHRLLNHQVQRRPRVVQQHREHPVEAANAEVAAGRLPEELVLDLPERRLDGPPATVVLSSAPDGVAGVVADGILCNSCGQRWSA